MDEELFKGALDELSLKTAGGLELTAIVANESATQETFHKGEKVSCQPASERPRGGAGGVARGGEERSPSPARA